MDVTTSPLQEEARIAHAGAERRHDQDLGAAPEVVADEFVDLAAGDCASRYEENRSVSPEWLIGKHWGRGVPTRQEMLDLASRLIQMTQHASEHLAGGGDLPDFEKTDRPTYKIYDAVSRAQAQQQAKASPSGPSNRLSSLLSSGASLASFGNEAQRVREHERYDQLLDAEHESQAGLSALQHASALVRTELARVAKPKGLWRAAAAFAYLTAVGVVVPIVGLAWRPVPSDLLSRRVLISLFLSGLAALGWYLVWAVGQLTKPSKLPLRNETS